MDENINKWISAISKRKEKIFTYKMHINVDLDILQRNIKFGEVGNKNDFVCDNASTNVLGKRKKLQH